MFDTFLQMDGIKGESTDDKHKDWSEVTGFSHGMSQPVSTTRSSSGGASSGRTVHGDFVVFKYMDSSSPKLYEAISNGKHFSKVKLECCRAGGSQVKFLEITMEEVMISKVQLSTNGSNGSHESVAGTGGSGAEKIGNVDLLPVEEVHLNYGKITWTYTQQKRKDGSGGGNVTANHDLTSGKGSS
jgi:type VI secretion system secreted protein Hcp